MKELASSLYLEFGWIELEIVLFSKLKQFKCIALIKILLEFSYPNNSLEKDESFFIQSSL